MNNLQTFADKTAISLSLICTIHCIALPLITVFLPSIVALHFEGEAFHQWMLVGVIPTSLLALMLGCKKHRHYRVLTPGLAGLGVLIVAALIGHDTFGETIEKVVTIIGATLIAFSHLYNHRLCQEAKCECHS